MTIKSNLGFEEDEELSLQKAIDYHLNNKQNIARERNYFYVTEVTKSKKELYNALKKGSSFNVGAQGRRIFDNGDSVHERYARYFAEMGILVASEIDINANDIVHGRLDCIITDGEKNYVVEIKSCSMWTFNKLTEPSFPHFVQIQFYLYFTNIENGLIIYENKDNQTNKVFSVKLDRKLVEKYLEELVNIKSMADNNIEPTEEPIKIDELKYI